MSSISDRNSLLNVQNLTNGEIVDVLDNDFMTNDSGFFAITSGQYHLIKTIIRLINDGHDVCIKRGYKS